MKKEKTVKRKNKKMRNKILEAAGIDNPPIQKQEPYTQSQIKTAFDGIITDYIDFMKRMKDLDFNNNEDIKIVIDELENMSKLSRDYNNEIKSKKLPEFIRIMPETITPQIKKILINKLKKYGQYLKMEQNRLKKENEKPVSNQQKQQLINKLGVKNA